MTKQWSYFLMSLTNPFAASQYYSRRIISYIDQRLKWEITKGIENTILQNKSDMTILSTTPYSARTLLLEFKEWEYQYLPSFNIKGKTILDIGACCGESAYMYFKHGASKVIGIEKDSTCHFNLLSNILLNKWNMETINDYFRLEHLDLFKYDLVKMDIEGSESILLYLDKIDFPLIVETHFWAVKKYLMQKFPELKIKFDHPIYDCCILSNCG